MSHTKIILGFAFAIVTVVGVPSLGHAQSCSTNADCVKGTTCQNPTNPSAQAIAPPCADGKSCDADAAVVSTSECRPASCHADSDCGTNMVCHTDTVSPCSGGGTAPACPAGTDCGVAVVTTTPPECTTTTTSTCAYRWQLPCNSSADCGADFVCMPSESGSCSGSSGSGSTGSGTVATTSSTGGGSGSEKPSAVPVGSGDPVVSVDGGTTCTTTTSFPGYCQAAVNTCLTDSDCPTDWTCVRRPVPVTGGGTTTTQSASDVAVGAGTTPVDDSKACQPPSAFPTRGGMGNALDSGKGGSGGGETTGAPGADAGTKPVAQGASSGNSGCGVVGSSSIASESTGGIALLALLFGFVSQRRRPARRGARIGV